MRAGEDDGGGHVVELVVGRQTAETEGEIIRTAVVASGTKTNLPQSVSHWLLVLNKNCRQKNKDFFFANLPVSEGGE